MDIYLDFGKNNHAKFNGLLIHSNDDYFDCHIEGMSNRFRIDRHSSIHLSVPIILIAIVEDGRGVAVVVGILCARADVFKET